MAVAVAEAALMGIDIVTSKKPGRQTSILLPWTYLYLDHPVEGAPHSEGDLVHSGIVPKDPPRGVFFCFFVF